MRKTIIYLACAALIILGSCAQHETVEEIISRTISSIDTIETICYKQEMQRTNPRQLDDTIFRYREMYFQRLIRDSIVGVKGHWYFYGDDRKTVNYEDIFDGDRLVRKNNPDSLARLYDLVKYPAFRDKHFWSHNTPYGMQYEFMYMLENEDFYTMERLNDTIFMNTDCYQILVRLEDHTTMPGFATSLEASKGSISSTLYFIDKQRYYPIRMYALSYSNDQPDQKYFIEQIYFDIKFNPAIDENVRFNTSDASLRAYKVAEMKQ